MKFALFQYLYAKTNESEKLFRNNLYRIIFRPATSEKCSCEKKVNI